MADQHQKPDPDRRAVPRRAALLASSALGATALVAALASALPGAAQTPGAYLPPRTPDLEITEAAVRYQEDLNLLVFDLRIAGEAGATTPTPHGAFDGAPVLGYVVPTTLPAAAVGFGTAAGTVALAVTSHPDFDDTPLWDESADGDYANDGELWHAHWVLLVEDVRAPGGLAVKEVVNVDAEILPPTNAPVPIYLDSPGFPVDLAADEVRVVVPAPRIGGETTFSFDAASASLVVNTSDPSRPTLGVQDIYGVLSGDLSLPYEVERE